MFDNLRTLHGKHVLQAKYEAFEQVLGEHASDDVWKYVEKEEVRKGSVLCVAGEVNEKLYVLQQGRLTSYLTAQDGRHVRLHTMTRGAYVNEESLFLALPVSHSIVADKDSIVLSCRGSGGLTALGWLRVVQHNHRGGPDRRPWRGTRRCSFQLSRARTSIDRTVRLAPRACHVRPLRQLQACTREHL